MIFLDTNILVYAYDNDEKVKHQRAKDILLDCWDRQVGALSTQVLQEFYVTVTAKLPKKLPIQEARAIVEEFLSWSVQQIAPQDIIAASELQGRYRYSFWDSLIITSAHKSGADTLYSEDLQDGQQIDGLSIVNPFK